MYFKEFSCNPAENMQARCVPRFIQCFHNITDGENCQEIAVRYLGLVRILTNFIKLFLADFNKILRKSKIIKKTVPVLGF